jgi:hypothetical protein
MQSSQTLPRKGLQHSDSDAKIGAWLYNQKSCFGISALLPPTLLPLGGYLMSFWLRVSLLKIKDNKNICSCNGESYKALKVHLSSLWVVNTIII